jgi:hypothetical protein
LAIDIDDAVGRFERQAEAIGVQTPQRQGEQ